MAIRINCQVSDIKRRVGHNFRLLMTAQCRTDSGNQFFCGIRFCQIIISTCIQHFNFSVHTTVRRQVNNRNRADFSYVLKNFIAIFHGIIRIKDNDVHLALSCQIYHRITNIVYQTGKSFFFQLKLHKTADTRITFNY